MWYIVLISETLLAKPVKKYISCHIRGDEAKSEFLFKTRNFNVQTRRFGTVFDGWAKIIAIYFAADNISTAVCKTPYIVLHYVNGYENHAVMKKRTKKKQNSPRRLCGGGPTTVDRSPRWTRKGGVFRRVNYCAEPNNRRVRRLGCAQSPAAAKKRDIPINSAMTYFLWPAVFFFQTAVVAYADVHIFYINNTL